MDCSCWWVVLAWGRLEKIPFPENITFLHALVPGVLLLLTRFGIPVSTTFLVLSIFATGKTIEAMVIKSALGYGVAVIAGLVIWYILSVFIDELGDADESSRRFWIGVQWLGTGFLWSQWLIQDMANIAVYLPREVPFVLLVGALSVLTIFLGIIFYRGGGTIQEIVISKTSTNFVRSAALINIVFGVILLVFKELSSIPMSTTWVFIGLLAGREIAIRRLHKNTAEAKVVFPMLLKDFFKISFGLAISIVIALAVSMYVA